MSQTTVQSRSVRSRAKEVDMAAKRGVKGPTENRRITLPLHFWELLERVAKLHSDAYVLMGGTTKYTVSDLLEQSSELFLKTLVEDLGPIPDEGDDGEKAFVKRLEKWIQAKLKEQMFGPSH